MFPLIDLRVPHALGYTLGSDDQNLIDGQFFVHKPIDGCERRNSLA